jgi:hypothetical protein
MVVSIELQGNLVPLKASTAEAIVGAWKIDAAEIIFGDFIYETV